MEHAQVPKRPVRVHQGDRWHTLSTIPFPPHSRPRGALVSPLSHFRLNVELTPVTYYDRATQIPSATTSTVTIFPWDKPVSYAARTTLQTSAPASTTRRRLNTSLTAEADGFTTG